MRHLFKILVCSVLMNVACAVNTPPIVTPTPPPIPASWPLQVTVRGVHGDVLPEATGSLQFDLAPCTTPFAPAENVDGRLVFAVPGVCSDTWGGNLTVVAPGYLPVTVRITQPDENQADILLSPPLPPIPTRDQVISVKMTFQGLTVTTQQLGTLTWFEPFFQTLNSLADRQAVYAAKHAQGDTHLILECLTSPTIIYNEYIYTNIVSQSCEANPQWFLGLVEEVIQNGFIPVVDYDGDAGDSPVNGYPNAARQVPILKALLASSQLGDLNPYVLYARLWDDVFYGSSPDNIKAFGVLFRQQLPNGYLAIEFNIGHIPVGGGPGDYNPGGRMTDYDVILGEFESWPSIGAAEWQILSRLLGPKYHDDPNQGPGNDGPWYLAAGSPRGPYFFSCFEWAEYPWSHHQIGTAEYLQGYAWYKARGCPNF